MPRVKLLFPYVLFGLVILAVVISNLPSADSTAAVGTAAASSVCEPCGMVVDADTAVSREVHGRRRYFCSEGCSRFSAGQAAIPDGERHGRGIDVVCHMEVNEVWGISSRYDGTTFHFCTSRCKTLFDAAPEQYLNRKCVVCREALEGRAVLTATYLGKSYEVCGPEHRVAFKREPAAYFMHTMWGIPTWLYYASIALVLVASFGLFDLLGRREAPASTRPAAGPAGGRVAQAAAWFRSGVVGRTAAPQGLSAGAALALPLSLPVSSQSPAPRAPDVSRERIDLLSFHWVRAAFRSRWFRVALQLVVVALFLVIVTAGLIGNQNPALNIAPLLTWTIWWGLLPLLILFAGKAWCYVCPWDALAGWAEKLSLAKKVEDGLSLNWRWPRLIRNIFIATILFIGLTWVELGFGVTMKPRVTAWLAVVMLLLAVVSALLFERKSFCRYGCLVGRVSGLYALFGGSEVRARSRATCQACRTKECVKGSDDAYGCPTFLYPGNLQTNTYCIQCMECVQACPHDNLAVNLRPWGSDLALEGRPRTDEAYLALLMLSITGFHGLTMTPAWQELVDGLRGLVGAGRILGFSVGMGLIMLAPICVYALLVAVSRELGRREARHELRYRDYFIRYAYALLPIALFYHLAHNLEHLLMEGPKILALISDPFGWNWNLFGTAGWNVPPLISLSKLWLVQVLLVLVGHVYSLWVAQKISLRLFGSARAAFRSQLPMLVGMICFSVFSLWLLKQPMEMRTSAM